MGLVCRALRGRQVPGQRLERSGSLGLFLRGSCTEIIQTARLWDSSMGEMKMEFRGHDLVIEIAVFAPAVAYPAIRELASLPVRVPLPVI